LNLPYLDAGAAREAFASLVRKQLLEFVCSEDVAAEHRLRKRLKKETMMLEQEIISSGDHFSLLGVFPRSSLSHLRHAYYRKTKILLDNRFEKFRSLQRQRVLLSAMLRRVYETLSVPDARRTYVDSFLKPVSSASGVYDKAEHKFREGLYWWECGYLAERLAFLESARLIYAENLKFWLYAAKAMMPMPELIKQAMGYFEHVIEGDRTRVEAHLGLAELCCREGAWERAASSLLCASEIDPSHPDVWRLGSTMKLYTTN
jgi:tetratricopeptide (TPR) repeat protein